MANGQQIAKQNIEKWRAWVRKRRACGDWVSFARGNLLCRADIARECSFAVSVLRQNPVIERELAALEAELRRGHILGTSRVGATRRGLRNRALRTGGRDRGRVKSLEQENAVLKAEIEEIKKRLERYEFLDQQLLETGRLIQL